MTRPEIVDEIAGPLRDGSVYQIHSSLDCSSWGQLMSLNPHSRNKERRAGDGILENEKQGNISMAHAIHYTCLCLMLGVFFSIETPKLSRAWHLPFFVWLFTLRSIYVIEIDQCAFGKRPSDWHPDSGDVRVRKPTLIVTNNPFLATTLNKRCFDVPLHEHKNGHRHRRQWSEACDDSVQ